MNLALSCCAHLFTHDITSCWVQLGDVSGFGFALRLCKFCCCLGMKQRRVIKKGVVMVLSWLFSLCWNFARFGVCGALPLADLVQATRYGRQQVGSLSRVLVAMCHNTSLKGTQDNVSKVSWWTRRDRIVNGRGGHFSKHVKFSFRFIIYLLSKRCRFRNYLFTKVNPYDWRCACNNELSKAEIACTKIHRREK